MTDILHTMTDTAASTPPIKKDACCELGTGKVVRRRQRKVIAVPKIASIMPGAATTRTACVIDAIVVAIDTEKMKNKR